jgi:pyrimidine deaminase RibD-like protein
MSSDSQQQQQEHLKYLRICLDEARKSPPKPTNFCVGALLLHNPPSDEPRILTTGYTLETPGNTHAEQSCFVKIAQDGALPEERVEEILPDEHVVLYTTMEPCWKRSVGNMPCVQRILRAKKIKKVVCGVEEPETFVGENEGRKILQEAGIEVVYVSGLEDEILKVATAGHEKDGKP